MRILAGLKTFLTFHQKLLRMKNRFRIFFEPIEAFAMVGHVDENFRPLHLMASRSQGGAVKFVRKEGVRTKDSLTLSKVRI